MMFADEALGKLGTDGFRSIDDLFKLVKETVSGGVFIKDAAGNWIPDTKSDFLLYQGNMPDGNHTRDYITVLKDSSAGKIKDAVDSELGKLMDDFRFKGAMSAAIRE